jgi:hypothetical protein
MARLLGSINDNEYDDDNNDDGEDDNCRKMGLYVMLELSYK